MFDETQIEDQIEIYNYQIEQSKVFVQFVAQVKRLELGESKIISIFYKLPITFQKKKKILPIRSNQPQVAKLKAFFSKMCVQINRVQHYLGFEIGIAIAATSKLRFLGFWRGRRRWRRRAQRKRESARRAQGGLEREVAVHHVNSTPTNESLPHHDYN